MIKKLYSCFLTVAMVLSLFTALPITTYAQTDNEIFLDEPPVSDECIIEGCTVKETDGGFASSEEIDGETYYHVSTPAQLSHINDHIDLNYIQTADIDLSQYNDGKWNPIGGYLDYDYDMFSGRYLGNGHKIENMTIDVSDSEDADIYAGLFGATSPEAHIEGINLKIDSLSATKSLGADRDMPFGDVFLGGIAATQISPTTIKDCHVTINGDITGRSYYGSLFVGGIAGYNIGKITNCSTTISADSVVTADCDGEAYVGGIAGVTMGSIFHSDNFGRLHVESPADSYTHRLMVGGIAGVTVGYRRDNVIENCQNAADIESINNCDQDNTYRAYAGGIVGHIDFDDSEQSIIIRNCANIGADKQVYTKAPSTLTGGIAGSSRFIQATNITIENCYNRSDVKSDMLNFEGGKKGEFCTGATAGGIIGASGGIGLQYCYSAATDISATATEGEDAYAGGIAGLIWDTILDQNYYETNENAAVGIGGAVDENYTIPLREDVAGEVKGATADQLKTKSFYGEGWRWYEGGGTAPDYYSSADPWRMVAEGTYPVLRGIAVSDNATLESLSVSGATLSPIFDPATTSYTANAGSSSSVTITAVAADALGTVTINGVPGSSRQVSLSPGSNRITVIVTAPDGMTTKTYTFDINRSTGGGGGGSSTPSTYSIIASHNEGGTISPSGTANIVKNTSKTFTITPATGYVISDVLVDGKSVGAMNTYTFSSVNANHRIEAKFIQDFPSKKFTDVDSTKWYREGIDFALSKELFNGTSDTTFEPDTSINRAMLVTVLWRLEKEPGYSVSNMFTDVTSGTWYTDAVAWATENDIVTGYDERSFGPDDPITREQMAAMLYRYASFKGYDLTATSDLTAFADAADVSEWALTAMKWAVGEDLIEGVSDTRLDPTGDATRAQVAAILMRFMQNIVK